MHLSIQQRYLLDLIRRLAFARRKQLYALAGGQTGLPGGTIQPHHVDAMLTQLRHCLPEIRFDGDLVLFGKPSPSEDLLEAVDVMLELAGDKLTDFRTEPGQEGGILLRFMAESEGKLRLFCVLRYFEAQAFRLPELPVRPTERVIFLMGGGKLPCQLSLPFKHFFALRQENGTHRFFAGGDQ